MSTYEALTGSLCDTVLANDSARGMRLSVRFEIDGCDMCYVVRRGGVETEYASLIGACEEYDRV